MFRGAEKETEDTPALFAAARRGRFATANVIAVCILRGRFFVNEAIVRAGPRLELRI